MLGLSDVTRTSILQSLTARELPLAVEGYMVYCSTAAFGSDCNSGNSPQCVDWMCLISGIRKQILSSVNLFSSMDGGT